ncbi:hypothetical protein LQ327_08350 [Actinomycetospora endophytica]|uniref:Uncharacterized protein n=1 Tax=Actinomycetospora endophytica TaxID=2291215 RepID=A0ABS8P559_9PSEU|nr:hypothetical protein [Actinomycetospora endophytica]MCD2193395.1 hypothetical protein [Actinomycetospora endophytica]
MSSTPSGAPEAPGRAAEPEDARRGYIAPMPTDADEARADREMAAAERAVAQGGAGAEQTRRIGRIAQARTHEERRRLWLEG